MSRHLQTSWTGEGRNWLDGLWSDWEWSWHGGVVGVVLSWGRLLGRDESRRKSGRPAVKENSAFCHLLVGSENRGDGGDGKKHDGVVPNVQLENENVETGP